MKTLRLLGIVLAPFLVVSCSSQPIPQVRRSSYSEISVEKLEERIFAQVNEERSKKGLPVLARDSRLDGLARQHSQDLASRAERTRRIHISHDGFQRRAAVAREMCQYMRTAENVGVTAGIDGVQPVSDMMVSRWMASRGHRLNLLNAWQASGLGVAQAEGGLGVYVTQLFASH